ncbi:hypothetical protein SCALM49S_01651 [Streptomyces californicus]
MRVDDGAGALQERRGLVPFRRCVRVLVMVTVTPWGEAMGAGPGAGAAVTAPAPGVTRISASD